MLGVLVNLRGVSGRSGRPTSSGDHPRGKVCLWMLLLTGSPRQSLAILSASRRSSCYLVKWIENPQGGSWAVCVPQNKIGRARCAES